MLNPHKESFGYVPSMQNIFTEIEITEEEYDGTLLVSFDSDCQIYLKRKPNASFINYKKFR